MEHEFFASLEAVRDGLQGQRNFPDRQSTAALYLAGRLGKQSLRERPGLVADVTQFVAKARGR